MKKTTKAFFMAFVTYLILEESKLCDDLMKAIIKSREKKNRDLIPKPCKAVSCTWRQT